MNLLFAISLQAQNNPSTTYGDNSNPYGESGKCYAQCFIPGDTITTTETIKIKPGYKEPRVVKGYPSTTKLNYVVKEACSTCELVVEKSTDVREEEVVVKPGYWEYFTMPCAYETVYDTILIKEESVKYTIHPAVFGKDIVKLANGGTREEGICIPAVTRTEKRSVEIEEACTEIEVADYIWEDEDFTYEVQAASKKWVKRKEEGNCFSSNPDDCLIWCLEDLPPVTETCVRKVKKGCPYGFEDNGEYCVKETPVPAKTKDYEVVVCVEEAKFEKATLVVDGFVDVPVTVLLTPARVEKTIIPAEYDIVERQVLVKPAGLDSIYHDPETDIITLTFESQKVNGINKETPAVTESCEKVLCVQPGVEFVEHEPEYKTITKIEIKKGDFTSWEEVLCPADLDNYTIGLIQQALQTNGYDPGPADNLIGDKTKSALTNYQKDKGLPIGQLNLKTLKSLGINY